MHVEILNKTDMEMQFLVEGIKPSFASALRRTMMMEVPTMAVEWVDFKKNNSSLNDEIVANRLGHIPLTYDSKAYNIPDECKCEGKGCSNCQVKLVLKKKGPGIVYSGDLKSTAKDVKPVFDKIPITELFEDQEIQFEATSQLGFGKIHSKWQGAIVGYQEEPVILEKEAGSCPVHKLLSTSKGYVLPKSDCEMCIQSANSAKKKSKLEGGFIFNVESVSGLKPDEIVLLAAEVLEKKFSEFGKDLKKLK